MTYRVGIIGAGIIGLATARQLAQSGVRRDRLGEGGRGRAAPDRAQLRRRPRRDLLPAGIGQGQDLPARRRTLLRTSAPTHGLPYDERGKLVVARDEAETQRLREIERRAQANGVPGVRWLDGPDSARSSRDVAGVAALLSPTTAIVDFPAVARAFADDLAAAGGQVLTSPRSPRCAATATACRWSRRAGRVGVAAGDLRRACSPTCWPGRRATRPRRRSSRSAASTCGCGPSARDRVRGLIYPVPDPAYPFLGVHLTPRIDGDVGHRPQRGAGAGPGGLPAARRLGRRQLARLARSAAFRRLARQHWRAGLREMRGSVSRSAFLAEARSYLPWLESGHVVPAPAGVRAQAVDPDGSLVDDFRIRRIGPVTAVRNAPSPAATSSMAIADYIANQTLPCTADPARARLLTGKARARYPRVGCHIVPGGCVSGA